MLRRGPECKKTAGPEDQSRVYTQVTTHCLLHTPTSSHLGPIAPGAGGGVSVSPRGSSGCGGPITNVPPRELHSCIPVDIGQQAQAEALRVGGISEAIHCHGRL